ncbi:DUF397 domain-containing protein [Saccharomonospora viridis]|uniref:DUF397 domain-containing protein n=1 Tax=Saccharomonospora viridis TaxID=1852 RepID=A0A837D518_9PSEU|nr:DUF397 domain-containing protein [Saccharomonospora viridis]KHF42919.1 hypothetical protein MINT15_31210 [Saccharomonospora viridis]SFO88408.1 protein of unknown function [Saccharomonospora viridis]
MTVQHEDNGWRKSSFSSAGQDCVEFRRIEGGVEVRNSKRPDEATIRYTIDEWRAFVAGVKAGEFDV